MQLSYYMIYLTKFKTCICHIILNDNIYVIDFFKYDNMSYKIKRHVSTRVIS